MLANEDYEDAAKIYKRLLPVDTAFVEVYHEMGVCQCEHPRQARQGGPHYFEKGVARRYIESYYELAMARHRQQRFDDAVDLLRSLQATETGRGGRCRGGPPDRPWRITAKELDAATRWI